MRFIQAVASLGMLLFVRSPLSDVPAARAATPGTSALETDPTGWTDLMPGKDLSGWTRLPIPPDIELSAKNPWSVDAERNVLKCDGVGVKEMFLQSQPRTDGIFHVEWRFPKVEDVPDYNSGVYVRTAADGKFWHQVQVAYQQSRPVLGDIFYPTLVDGQPKLAIIEGKGRERGKPVGEWNTYEITCKGKTVSVWINGAVTVTWKNCKVPAGHLGLQAELWNIEFRNLKFKPLK